jgi:hypothetical protein
MARRGVGAADVAGKGGTWLCAKAVTLGAEETAADGGTTAACVVGAVIVGGDSTTDTEEHPWAAAAPAGLGAVLPAHHPIPKVTTIPPATIAD